jgi:adenosine kinase
LENLIPYCDYIIGNEAEAESWATSNGLSNPKDIPAVAKALALTPKKNTARPRTVIITQGLLPSIVATVKSDGDVELKEFPVHPIEKEKINDTNGAGDAFAGGFLAGLVQGKNLDESIHIGQWLAKLSIQELGPSYPFPKQAYTGSY